MRSWQRDQQPEYTLNPPPTCPNEWDQLKLFPDRVDFRQYRLEHEDFIGPNFVAVRAKRADILDALGAR
jgi:hypothetical protein